MGARNGPGNSAQWRRGPWENEKGPNEKGGRKFEAPVASFLIVLLVVFFRSEFRDVVFEDVVFDNNRFYRK